MWTAQHFNLADVVQRLIDHNVRNRGFIEIGLHRRIKPTAGSASCRPAQSKRWRVPRCSGSEVKPRYDRCQIGAVEKVKIFKLLVSNDINCQWNILKALVNSARRNNYFVVFGLCRLVCIFGSS